MIMLQQKYVVGCSDGTDQFCCERGVRDVDGDDALGWNYQGRIICDANWTEYLNVQSYCTYWALYK